MVTEPLWPDLADEPPAVGDQPPPTIDIRSEAAFLAGHYVGSLSFPRRSVLSRTNELPPKGDPVPMRVVVPSSMEGDVDDAERTVTADVLASLQVGGWTVRPCTLSADDGEALAVGPAVPRRLWQPAALLLRCIDRIEAVLGGPGVALDVGCGCGRDMCFLVQRGWHVVGADSRRKILADAQAFAGHVCSGVGPPDYQCASFAATLAVRPASVDLVLAIRFLHRPLLPALARAVRPGGFLLYHHFVDGVQHSAVGHPKNPAAYLQHGELRSVFVPPQVFSGDDGDGHAAVVAFEACVDFEATLPDGRPTTNFVGRRLPQPPEAPQLAARALTACGRSVQPRLESRHPLRE